MAELELSPIHPSILSARFSAIRKTSEDICKPLATEDYVIQSSSDVSPPKWHLAHTSWFFENFILVPYSRGYEVFHPKFGFLFNSYYVTIGEFFERSKRGLLSRPTVDEIYNYRKYVDQAILALIETSSESLLRQICSILILGLNHEQQHQELLLTDIKHLLASNPLRPYYSKKLRDVSVTLEKARPLEWVEYLGGITEVGASFGGQFVFDNETPRHKVFQDTFRLAHRLITNGEWLEFIEAGSYKNASLWLSDGWAQVQKQVWSAPLYWEKIGSEWWMMTLGGMRPVIEAEPVSHVSFYEADAFAKWKGLRLPTEAEWEYAASRVLSESKSSLRGNFYESGLLHPSALDGNRRDEASEIAQLFGDVWEWTSSSYEPYPGYQPWKGSVGEYNGKFMCNQKVLRGGSCATSLTHIRSTYRNFFQPESRWQFSGVRLAACNRQLS